MDLTTLLTSATEFFLDEPFLRMQQGGVMLLGVVLVYLILFTTRDILLRTNSLLYMLFSILLVTVFPIVGFLLYLLIRPARTIKQRELSMLVDELAYQLEELRHPTPLFSSHEVPKDEPAKNNHKKKTSKSSS